MDIEIRKDLQVTVFQKDREFGKINILKMLGGVKKS
jgi:hypothetical protein